MARTVIVCGGRNFDDRRWLEWLLNGEHARLPIGTLVHGAARGADTLADRWAKKRGVQVVAYPAEWWVGPQAGPVRNRRMLSEHPDAEVIAFPGGRGTADMIRASTEAGRKVTKL